MKTINILAILFIILLANSRFAHSETQSGEVEDSYSQAADTVQQQLEDSLAELSKLREQMANEKIPLNRKLNDLEGELVKVRRDYQKTSRLLDSHTLDLSNLRNEIKTRQEETTYLSNLLSEYIRNFESRLHIAEIQRYEKQLETAKLAPENSNLSEQEVYKTQAGLITISLERLEDALGGSSFKGTAVDPGGLVKKGTFVLLGPTALFSSEDGQSTGFAEQRLGSLEPSIISFQNPLDTEAAEQVITDTGGHFPLDPTLGNAHKIEATKETLWEHVQKGGLVMVPIFTMAGAALFVALYKWIVLAFQRNPSHKKIKAFLNTIASHDKDAAKLAADELGGPVGNMLSAGVDHLKERVELIEEIMYETILSTRLKLQSMLPFIAISASSAPLLGLLGTVTGIINTFKLITVFGSGDVKSLSGGISEALITTKFGLVVAIPSLLIHAFLSRKARGVVAQMEKAAVTFINQVNKTPYEPENECSESEMVIENSVMNNVESEMVIENKVMNKEVSKIIK